MTAVPMKIRCGHGIYNMSRLQSAFASILLRKVRLLLNGTAARFPGKTKNIL